MRNRRVVALVPLIVAAVAVAAVGRHLWHNGAAAPEAQPLAAEAAKLPRPEHPAFTVPPASPLSRNETRARFAPILRRIEARTRPDAAAPVVAELSRETPEGTANIVLVIAERRGWVRVRLPVLPNGTTAWVPRRALGGYAFVHTRLVVDRRRLTATLLYDGRKIFSAPVGIGTPESPTPAGEFYVRDRLNGFGDPFYGPVAFGTSAHSAVLTDWPDGGFVGIHGTNAPELIPGAVSHGCVRLRNTDIVRLSRLMPVGTPLTIR
jgi:lipoprotein-anchoring transpeptidase ErfK/SrfK